MSDVKENFQKVIKSIIYENAINSTFEARQNYYKLFPETEIDEFPIFFTLSQTGINLEVPKKIAFGLNHFIEYMKKQGWSFNRQNVIDFELSETYGVIQPHGVESGHKQWEIDLAKYQSSINLPFLLEKMYYESGFITDTGEPVSLYKGCKFADKCWAGIDERKPDNEEVKWSYLSFPWIGEKYYKNKILILGINTYEGGGFEYNTQIITEARAELEEGKKRINFGYVFPDGKKYAGTFLWHRIACYTMAIREAIYCDSDDIYGVLNLEDKIKDNRKIAAEYENNSFLNHVKCSPKRDRSNPTTSMWKNCGAHVLKHEIELLTPDYLLVLGVGDNINYLKNNVLDGDISENNVNSDAKLYYTKHFKKPLKVIAVPHPSNSIKESLILDVFELALQAKRIYM